MTWRDTDGHRLAVGLADELELHATTQQAHGHAKKVSFIAGSEGYSVGSGVGGTRLACGVDGLRDSYARRKILANDDIVSGRSLDGLTVNGCSCTQSRLRPTGGQAYRISFFTLTTASGGTRTSFSLGTKRTSGCFMFTSATTTPTFRGLMPLKSSSRAPKKMGSNR